MATHQTCVESVRSEAACTEAILALAHRLTLLFFIRATLCALVLPLPVLEDVIYVSGGLLLLLIVKILLLQVLVHLIHKVQVEGLHEFVRLKSLLMVVMAVPTISITAPTVATPTVNITKALPSVHEGFIPVA